MEKEKCEKDSTFETCDQTNSCSQQEKETHVQERLGLALFHIRRRPGGCTIPEWIKRWALGR
jgi:hypothetical protein